jgi:DNA modification methylase
MITTLYGDCAAILPTLPERSVQTIVTSPPYFGLRSYLADDHPQKALEIGSEPLHDCLGWARGNAPCGDCYVCALRAVFASCWRVLRDDGTLWLNIGDTYHNPRKWGGRSSNKNAHSAAGGYPRSRMGTSALPGRAAADVAHAPGRSHPLPGLKDKELIGIPWRVALALQADGWTLRNEIIWWKKNPMPESPDDRCARDHEPIYLFSKRPDYFFDAVAIMEPARGTGPASFRRVGSPRAQSLVPGQHGTHRLDRADDLPAETRNARTVWSLATGSYDGNHYASFPEALAARCILAGSAARACEHCGAAWERIIEKEFVPQQDVEDAAGRRKRLDRSSNWDGVPRGTNRITTVGWRSRCRCANAGAGRSVVLDPFCGTGTVLRAAERLGRDSVGIELNEEGYAPLIEARTDRLQLYLPEVVG